MIRRMLMAAVILGASVTALAAQDTRTVMVGGAAMFPSKNIVANALNSKDHTTLVAAVKAAGLVETLQGPGPFTVFAPTNAAFAKLPAGTVNALLEPANKAMLTGVLTDHVVPGRLDAGTLAAQARNGVVELKTVAGGKLWVMTGDWTVKDEKGTIAKITIPDVYQSNGVIHVIDSVVMAR
jgi:uncharacterized surface protein with fasciclin (FAS1) repeats